MADISDLLNAPLDPSLVKIHPQTKARYLDGRHYIETANRIFGYGNWQFRILSAPTRATEGKRSSGKYYALWTVTGELQAAGATFVDLGTCEQNGEGPEATDMAMKGSVTDALKRCLRNYGDQFGLVLYDKELSYQDMAEAYNAAHGGSPVEPKPAAPRERVDRETGEIQATAHAGGGAVSTPANPAGETKGGGVPAKFELGFQQLMGRLKLTWTDAAVIDVLGAGSAAAINNEGWTVWLDRWWAAGGYTDGRGVADFEKAIKARIKEMAA